MELKDLKVGMKVKIPKTKSVWGPVSESIIIKKALKDNQDYLYFAGIDKEEGYIILDHEKNTHNGDFFLLQDIELYEEEFILPEKWAIRDTIEVKEFFEKYNSGGYTCGNTAYLHYPKISRKCYFKTLQKDYLEITLEQFKKYVLIEEEKEEQESTKNLIYSVKELEEREDLVIYLDNEEDFKKIRNTTNKLFDTYYGKYCYSLAKNSFSSLSSNTDPGSYSNAKIITIDQIKELNMEEKEIVGYKLIKPEYEEAAIKICRFAKGGCIPFEDFLKRCKGNCYEKELKQAGVLDLWFEPVFFEEETFKIGDWITITDTKGITGWMDDTDKRTFKIHGEKTKFHAGFLWQLKKGRGVYGEFRLATPEEIIKANNITVKLSIGKNVDIGRDKLSNQVFIIAEGKTIQFRHINNLYCNTNTFGDTGWKIQYNTFDIGCWKNITREDLKLIIDAYEEING
jgi:hypothetical protein